MGDNTTQFIDRRSEDFRRDLKIIQLFLSMEYPQTNRLAEAANKIIIIGLKKMLEQAKALWADELSVVLWAYHTMP